MKTSLSTTALALTLASASLIALAGTFSAETLATAYTALGFVGLALHDYARPARSLGAAKTLATAGAEERPLAA